MNHIRPINDCYWEYSHLGNLTLFYEAEYLYTLRSGSTILNHIPKTHQSLPESICKNACNSKSGHDPNVQDKVNR